MPLEPRLENADLETSSAAYARRFSGPVGAWFLEVQARATLELLAPFPRASVLDLGGGHGQVTRALLQAGHSVTVFGSPGACGEVVRELVQAGRARFLHGDLLKTGLPDRGFDVVLSYRLLPHVSRWPELVAEACRLARQAVVVDYPTKRSVNALAEAFFGMKKSIEGDTRPFHVFEEREVADAFSASRFRETGRRPQFVFPMALHRGLGSARVASGLEAVASGLGLTRALGSPVILRTEREVS